ncbi:MAG: hypothetical protein K2X01_03770 [Cyanobacteria bacterium]|nr:hypothetical protein [Cyanobacteriota bacterium]
MIKIRALRPNEWPDLLTLLGNNDLGTGLLRNGQNPAIRWMDWGCQWLPPGYQPDLRVYIAIAHQRILGAIMLRQDGRTQRRWCIEHLILDSPEEETPPINTSNSPISSYDVAGQLLQYIINRYGADGVQTFLAHVDHEHLEGQALLKASGFRPLCKRLTALRESPETPDSQQEIQINVPSGDLKWLQHIREAEDDDRDALRELYRDSLPVETRSALERSSRDFSRSAFRRIQLRLQGIFAKRWVLGGNVPNQLLGCIELSSPDFQEFHLNLFNCPGWDPIFAPMLQFAVEQTYKSTNQPRIVLQSYTLNEHQQQTLLSFGFVFTRTDAVWVKDYWVPIDRQSEQKRASLLLFASKTSPACQLRP